MFEATHLLIIKDRADFVPVKLGREMFRGKWSVITCPEYAIETGIHMILSVSEEALVPMKMDAAIEREIMKSILKEPV